MLEPLNYFLSQLYQSLALVRLQVLYARSEQRQEVISYISSTLMLAWQAFRFETPAQEKENNENRDCLLPYHGGSGGVVATELGLTAVKV